MKRFSTMVLGLGLAISSAAAAPEYFPRDLGTLGGAQSAATGVNDLSQVVGWSPTSAADPARA